MTGYLIGINIMALGLLAIVFIWLIFTLLARRNNRRHAAEVEAMFAIRGTMPEDEWVAEIQRRGL